VSHVCHRADAMCGAMPTYGRNRRSESRLVFGLETKRSDQSLSRISVRVRCAAFELLDAMHAEACSLGQILLRQSGLSSILAEQLAKCNCRTCRHRAAPA
jgi:hypothetical protein